MTTTVDRPLVREDKSSSLTDDGSVTPNEHPARPGGDSLDRYVRVVLALCSLAAGAIHFAVAGDHYSVSWTHGAFLAAVGWLQLVWAAAIVFKPARRVLILGLLGNAALLCVWAMAKVWGVPVEPGAWTPENIGWQDGIASICEGVIVGLGLAVLAMPSSFRRRVSGWIGWPVVASVAGVIGLVSSLAFTPSWAAGSHHDRAADGAHDHSGATAPTGTTPCGKAMPNGANGAGHGLHGPMAEQHITDRAVRDELAQQLTEARAVAQRMPTVADATAAGYVMVDQYVPCIGAHYIKAELLVDGFDPSRPEELLYDGTAPDSRIVGLSYLQLAGKGAENEPEGFAGPNDSWHTHERLCLGNGVVLGGNKDNSEVSPEECARLGGQIVDLSALLMVHAWIVPGWESAWGTFSSEHPDLGGTIGDINGTPQADAAT